MGSRKISTIYTANRQQILVHGVLFIDAPTLDMEKVWGLGFSRATYAGLAATWDLQLDDVYKEVLCAQGCVMKSVAPGQPMFDVDFDVDNYVPSSKTLRFETFREFAPVRTPGAPTAGGYLSFLIAFQNGSV